MVHLASIVTPGAGSTREFEYSVDVLGTRNVLEACVAQGVQHIVVSSSGAAYGYHADNPAWIDENQALRGNAAFAYSDHKRLVEEMLAAYRIDHPALQQTVLRIGTILGARVHNQITALFDKPRILAIRGSDSPFVFIWDEDVTGCVVHAITSGRTGCFNVAGDGALTLPQIAALLRKPLLSLPASLLQAGADRWARGCGISRYGPEQLDFLRYRPVLCPTSGSRPSSATCRRRPASRPSWPSRRPAGRAPRTPGACSDDRRTCRPEPRQTCAALLRGGDLGPELRRDEGGPARCRSDVAGCLALRGRAACRCCCWSPWSPGAAVALLRRPTGWRRAWASSWPCCSLACSSA